MLTVITESISTLNSNFALPCEQNTSQHAAVLGDSEKFYQKKKASKLFLLPLLVEIYCQT